MKILTKNEFIVYSVLVIMALLTFSCEKDTISGDVVSDPKLINELYSKSIDTLYYESNEYILEAELFRNFFPGGPVPERRPLQALIFLVNADSLPVTSNLAIVKLFIINSDQIWIANLRDRVNPYVPEFKLDKLNTEGPEWDTGILVDVILEIKDNLTLETYFLIARQQYIQRAA